MKARSYMAIIPHRLITIDKIVVRKDMSLGLSKKD
jgi:hypothetical protein